MQQSTSATRSDIKQACNDKDHERPAVKLLLGIINNYKPIRQMLTVQPKNAKNAHDMCLGRMLIAAEVRSRSLASSFICCVEQPMGIAILIRLRGHHPTESVRKTIYKSQS